MTDTETLIASPCISICVLDEQDTCVGCFRTALEITRWSDASNPERHEIIARAHERAARANPFI